MRAPRKYITRKFLVDNWACEEQLALFDEHFPSGRVLVTAERAAKFSSRFSFFWLVQRTLVDFDAWMEYRNKRELARINCNTSDEYLTSIAIAWAEAFLSQTEPQT